MNLGFTEHMGPKLREEVERHLLLDLQYYGCNTDELLFDWSETCPEGHVTRYLDGSLENWSGVGVVDPTGKLIAAGWLDFIHGGGDNPLFIFWDILMIGDKYIKGGPGIPQHIWDRLPEASKELCMIEGKYDAAWCKDPLVVTWKRNKTK